MEIRVLEYFLAIAREQSISKAAEVLHLSQPTLSRQIKDMEDKLGKQLFIRGNRRISLTNEGMLLRKRAEEIVNLVQKTENEISSSNEIISGKIHIGSSETYAISIIAEVATILKQDYPNITYNITSGDAVDIKEKLDKGLFDFCIMLDHVDTSKYNYINLPTNDIWGVLMRKDSPLAEKEYITPEDLWDKSLLFSRQSAQGGVLMSWLKKDISQLNITTTYNLIYNAAVMVEYGMGYALCIDKIINTTGDSSLYFKPLYPKLEIEVSIVWKKYQVFSKASEKFLEMLQKKL